MLDCVMLDRAFGNNEDNGIKHVGGRSIRIAHADIPDLEFFLRAFYLIARS